jgi:hypothetical protein
MILRDRSITSGWFQRNKIVISVFFNLNTTWRVLNLSQVSVNQPVIVDLTDIMYQGK